MRKTVFNPVLLDQQVIINIIKLRFRGTQHSKRRIFNSRKIGWERLGKSCRRAVIEYATVRINSKPNV